MKLIESSEVTGVGHPGHVLSCIIYHQAILLREQRCRSRCVALGIPGDRCCWFESRIIGDGVSGMVGAAGHKDIDGLGIGQQRAVIPHKGDRIADFVVHRWVEWSRCDHRHYSRW